VVYNPVVYFDLRFQSGIYFDQCSYIDFRGKLPKLSLYTVIFIDKSYHSVAYHAV